jgi:hypothetical protein
MVSIAALRRLALGFPGAEEQDHLGSPSFRVRGRIFATLRAAPDRLMVKLDPEDQHNLAAAWPQIVSPVPGYWGRKGSTFAACDQIDEAQALTLLRLAWTRAAPMGWRRTLS